MNSSPSPTPAAKFEFDTDFFELAVPQAGGVAGGEAAAPVVKIPKNIQAALEEGRAAGYAQAVAELQAAHATELTALQAQLAAAVQALAAAQAAWAEQALPQLLALLRATLHRLVGHAAQHYPDQILELHLKTLLDKLRTGDEAVLRIAPAARGFHEKLGLHQASIHGRVFQIHADQALAGTDCCVEWRSGGLEARLHEHLAAVDALLASLQIATPALPPVAAGAEAVPPAQPDPATTAATTARRAQAAALLGDDELVEALK